MIYTERKVSIKNDKATIDSPIILFRGDREVEIMFTIVDSKFKFESNKGNVIDKTQAAFGQLAVALPDGTDLFTEIVECENGVVIFSITGEMIDEIQEVGFYSFHIRLYNDDKTSRITLPPVMEGIEIREPLIIEGDVENTDLVGDATVGYSMIQTYGVNVEVLDENGNYIPTVWGIGDKITAEKLNKIEEGINLAIGTISPEPYNDVSYKLAATEEEFSDTLWYKNTANDIVATTTYLYVTVIEYDNIDGNNWIDHYELVNGSWSDDTKPITHKKMSENLDRCVLYSLFTPNSERLSPDICIRTNGATLENTVIIKSYLYAVSEPESFDDSIMTTVGEIFISGKTITEVSIFDADVPAFGLWENKKILMIGDSITASGKIHPFIARSLHVDISTHAKGGIGIAQGVDGDEGYSGDFDNETDADGNLSPLTVNHVYDKDIILILLGYNNRYNQLGVQADIYPENNTIWGLFNHVIDRIYELLTESGNLKCRLMIVIPHAIGKYPYVNATAYEKPTSELPTFVEICDCIRTIAETYSIPICDLMRSSGINNFTWNIFSSSSSPINEQYTKYELDENGNKVNDTELQYVNGQSYYQNRDGEIVYEVYEGSAPFPYNGDQCHCSELGYKRIGECIIGALIHAFGNNIQ